MAVAVLSQRSFGSSGNRSDRSALSPLLASHRCSPNGQHQQPDIAGKDHVERRDRSKTATGAENCFKLVSDHKDSDAFVWRKKFEKDGLSGLAPRELRKLGKRKIRENLEELVKVRKLREQREREREQKREQREAESREDARWEVSESMWYGEWEKQDEQFFLGQVTLRTRIRLEQGRGQPIDFLARYIEHLCNDSAHGEMLQEDPESHVIGLDRSGLEDLSVDVATYRKLHGPRHAEFWDDVLTVVQHNLQETPSVVDSAGKGDHHRQRPGIHASVRADIGKIVTDKTFKQLCILEQGVLTKLREKNADGAYWDELLTQLNVQKARTRLRERHLACVRRTLIGATIVPLAQQTINTGPPVVTSTSEVTGIHVMDELITSEDADSKIMDTYDLCLLQEESLSKEVLRKIRTPEEDWSQLQEARKRVLARCHQVVPSDPLGPLPELTTEDLCCSGDFNDEVLLQEQQQLLQGSKFNPRKPRFSNRVFTGYVWNRYNRTHYDSSRPPPKMVMGYNFNIFYPDLLDKTRRPLYTITPCKDHREMATLRFSAGPPYQDVAFKVVDKEWDKSWKHGYRCSFNGTVLQLWFRFKRRIYRR